MQEHNVIDRINELCAARAWTYYRLAKESGIAYSTLSTTLHKSNAPSISTLIKICDGFGISLSEFFDEQSETAPLTSEEKMLLQNWRSLSEEEQTDAKKIHGLFTFPKTCIKKAAFAASFYFFLRTTSAHQSFSTSSSNTSKPFSSMHFSTSSRRGQMIPDAISVASSAMYFS